MSTKRKTLAGKQHLAVILMLVAIAVLAVGWLIARHITSINTFEDIDGTKYTIKRNGDAYYMYDGDGKLLDSVTELNNTYYVTDRDTMVYINDRGEAQIYSPVDTSDGEDLS